MILPSLFALLSSTSPSTGDSEARVWAGHQVLFGERRVPVIGTLQTRMDTWVLASVEHTDERIRLVQRVCRLEFAEVAGVRVEMAGHRLPPTTMQFRAGRDGAGMTVWSEVVWRREDVDRDGRPGVTVRIDAPICSGELYVSNRSVTWGRGQMRGGRFEGRQDVKVEQEILGAEGRCLSVTAKDTNERVAGPFAYVPVASASTCQSLLDAGWPIQAEG